MTETKLRKMTLPKTFSTLIAILGALLVVMLAAPAGAEPPPAPAGTNPAAKAFEQFQSLAGDWQGTDQDGQTVRLSYEVVAGGSAVLEHIDVEGDQGAHNMVTLYHLDGDALMLTHYCAARNQPRMRAQGLAADEVRFEFVDATGLASAGAGHMHRAKFEFKDEDRLTSSWTWNEDGADAFTVVVDAERSATMASK